MPNMVMTRWRFNVVFVLFIGGGVFLMLAKPVFGIDEVGQASLVGYGAFTTFVLAESARRTNGTDDKTKPAAADKEPT